MMGPPSAGERGAALVFALLLMLALVAVAHGALALALGELAASRAALRYVETRALAHGAVSLALRRPTGPWTDSVALGAVRDLEVVRLGRGEGLATARRLGLESWLLEGTGRLGSRARARTARLVWSMDPLTRVESLEGALNVGYGAPVELAGRVDVANPTATEPPRGAGDCAPWLPELVSHYATTPLLMAATDPDSGSLPALGLVDLPALLTLAEVTVSGFGSPSPGERLGACDREEPWGWGDPDRPTRPCGSHLPLRAAVGDLSVIGGAGQGVLVVGGSLTLTSGARYYGMVITGGPLRVEDGASLTGLAIAHGGVAVAADAKVAASACWAVRALAANRFALGDFVQVPRVGEIGPM
jgi:hypothetical protein